EKTPCPKKADRTAAVKIGSANRVPIVVKSGIAWPDGANGQFLADDATKPNTITSAELEKLVPRPERYLRRRCGDGGCGPHGGNVDLVIVDGAGERVIAKGQSEIEAAEISGDDVAWASFGAYGMSGGVFRAPVAGGSVTQLWDGAVHELLVDGTD